MIIGGGSRAGPGDLAAHLLRTDENEVARVIEIRGVPTPDLHRALNRMQAATGLTQNGKKGLYHASIDPDTQATMTPAQWARSVAVLEKELGLEGQPRALVYHVKRGEDGVPREHLHAVWQRTDIDTRTLRSDSWNYDAHRRAAIALEHEFGHALAPRQRNGQSLTKDERQQAQRTGVKAQDVGADLTAAWQATRTGQAFRETVEAQGYVLAQGDRGLIVIDREGGTHSVARRVEGAKAAAVRARMADVNTASLPDVEQARAMQRQAREMAQERPEPTQALDIAPEPPKAVQRPPEVQEGKPAERVDRQAEARARAEEEQAAQRQAAQIAARAEQQKQEAAAAKLEAETRAREAREQALLQENLDKAAERQLQALGQKHVRELKAFQQETGSPKAATQENKPAGISGLFSRAADRLNPARERERQAEADRRKREAEERRRQELEATLQRQERERVALEKQIAETQRQQMQEFQRLQEKIREQRAQAPKVMEPRQQSKEHGGGFGRERKGPGRGGPGY